MIKKFLFFAAIIMVGLTGTAQGQMPLEVGARQMNFGLLGSQSGLPLYVGMDFAVKECITIGGEVRPQFWSGGSFIGLIFNADYHFNKLANIQSTWDLYAGLNVGWDLWFGSSSGSSGIFIGGHIGGRYYWNEKWGVNVELGGGNNYSGGKLGLSMKM